MPELESPTYVIDLDDSFTRARIESAKPNAPFTLNVRPEHDLSAEPISASGYLSADEKSFVVEVSTDEGKQTHSWTWEFLKHALEARRNT